MQTTTSTVSIPRSGLIHAIWRGLKADFPHLNRHEVAERFLTAVEIWSNGHVGPLNPDTSVRVVWTVRSGVAGPGRFVGQEVESPGLTCTCPDAFWRSHDSGYLCVHSIAVWIANKLPVPPKTPAGAALASELRPCEGGYAPHGDLLTCARCGQGVINRQGSGWTHFEGDIDHVAVIALLPATAAA